MDDVNYLQLANVLKGGKELEGHPRLFFAVKIAQSYKELGLDARYKKH